MLLSILMPGAKIPSVKTSVRLIALLLLVATGPARATTAPPPDAADAARERAESAPDMLVFTDGDRVRGRLIGHDGEYIVFQSSRFGELRVKTDAARVIAAPAIAAADTGASAPAGEPAGADGAAADHGEAFKHAGDNPMVTATPMTDDLAEPLERPRWTSPAALAIALRDFLGPWQGRLGISASLVTTTSERRNLGLNLRFNREWERDEARIEFRYDLAQTENVTNTDLLEGSGLWRRELPGPWFFNYRPKLEWNRDHVVNGAAAEYVLLQNELGVGLNVIDTEHRKVRLGAAENVFDLWTLPGGSHETRDNQSMFAEIEFGLPWRMTLTNRGIWYYSIDSGEDGWENRFELTKKFSDALSLGVRQEQRRDNPDLRISDYELWRLQIGLDF